MMNIRSNIINEVYTRVRVSFLTKISNRHNFIILRLDQNIRINLIYDFDSYQPIYIFNIILKMSFRKSIMMTTINEPKINGLIQLCDSRKINLQKLSNHQLQTAYAMQGYKAQHKLNQKMCFVFISYASEQKFNISAYFEGQVLSSHQYKSKQQLAKIIEDSVMKAANNGKQSIQEQSTKIQKMFENLNKKSEQILKKFPNQIIAMQQVKSSNQYIKICNQMKLLSLEIKELCKITKIRQQKSQLKNEQLIGELVRVEQKKAQIQDIQYNYECLKQKIDSLDEMFDYCIDKKKKQFQQHKNFYDQHSFGRYLGALIDLKTVENQKKYVKRD